MKLLISLSLVLCAPLAFAVSDAAKDLASAAKVSDACAEKIMNKVLRQCNADAKAAEGGNLEHGCFYDSVDAQPNNGGTELLFTTGDADDWNYNVRISDESDANSCDFSIKSDN